MRSDPAQRRLATSPLGDLAAGLLLVAAAWLLYRRVLGLWFTYDDFFNLRWVLAYHPGQYCFDPAVWRRLPFRMLTPLLFLSHDADLALFGARAAPFHAHQLAALALAALALYAVLRLWLPSPWASAGAFLFLAGPPMVPLAALLYVRHYVEAAVLGVAAVGAWVLALRARGGAARWSLAAASAGLYLGASLAKEVAVPLALVLPLLPEGRPRRRLRLALPHAAAVALYTAYRVWMLGTAGGGYGWAVPPGGWPRLAAALPLRMARALLGEPTAPGGPASAGALAVPALGVLIVLLAAALCAAAASRRHALFLGAAALLAVLPVLPVAIEVVPRYAVASWLLLAAAFPFGARRALEILRARAPGAAAGTGRARSLGAVAVVAVAAVCLAALAVNRQVWARDLARYQRMSAENRAFLKLGPGELLAHPAGPPSSMPELAWFQQVHLGLPAGAGWYYDDLYLCTARHAAHGAPKAIWEYDPATRRVRKVTARAEARGRSFCSSIAWRAPLEATFRKIGHGVFWTLGPYRRGEYAFVLGDGRQRFGVPRRGGFQLPATRRLTLRVRHRSPEGRVTYSPELEIDLTVGEAFRWKRSPASTTRVRKTSTISGSKILPAFERR